MDIKKFKLNRLSIDELCQKEMDSIRGGGWVCGCGCLGPSGTNANGQANNYSGVFSEVNYYIYDEDDNGNTTREHYPEGIPRGSDIDGYDDEP